MCLEIGDDACDVITYCGLCATNVTLYSNMTERADTPASLH